jgi:hypothetical protein
MHDIFRVRGGYSIMATPFADGVATGGADFSRNTYTFGAGIREESFFIDFAYANTKSSEYDIHYIYSDGNGTNEGATVDNTISNFLLSLGFRF